MLGCVRWLLLQILQMSASTAGWTALHVSAERGDVAGVAQELANGTAPF
eukprot:SAG11_NODE_1870_length_4151_cov_2.279368_8_plen_49_part_00